MNDSHKNSVTGLSHAGSILARMCQSKVTHSAQAVHAVRAALHLTPSSKAESVEKQTPCHQTACTFQMVYNSTGLNWLETVDCSSRSLASPAEPV